LGWWHSNSIPKCFWKKISSHVPVTTNQHGVVADYVSEAMGLPWGSGPPSLWGWWTLEAIGIPHPWRRVQVTGCHRSCHTQLTKICPAMGKPPPFLQCEAPQL
jgi:hypothetical protein